MSETGKQVLWIIVGAIIFMMVYSVWTNPSSITEFIDNTKSNAKISQGNLMEDNLTA